MRNRRWKYFQFKSPMKKVLYPYARACLTYKQKSHFSGLFLHLHRTVQVPLHDFGVISDLVARKGPQI